MMIFARTLVALAASLAIGADVRTVCRNATWEEAGSFYTLWHDTGSACMHSRSTGPYTVTWGLGEHGNLVAGKGWSRGASDRVVRYTAHIFEPGSNGYLSLYGWSTNPLVEYYVVDDWGNFVPPGPGATLLGELASDGGVYRVYRALRVGQPSIAGTASFDQYWSVRTAKRQIGQNSTITFGNHVSAWRKLGLPLGTLDYQVIATEGFGSTGRSKISVTDR